MYDKVFNLLEKVYREIKEELKENSKDISRIENEMSLKFGILFDANKTINERLERIENKLDELSDKVDKHDIKIQIIEGGKKKT